MTGRLVVLEGPEAVGKSTQARRLASELGALCTNEPGGTPLGLRLREQLLAAAGSGEDHVTARAETLLMLADRAQHVGAVIQPALDGGRWVVSDRYTPSTLAYQGWGRGLEPAELSWLCDWATVGLRPDLTVLLQVPPAEALRRQPAPTDRFEAETAEFFSRVSAGYAEMAASDPERWAVVDGAGDPAEVTTRIIAEVEERLGRPD